jgi:iron(III) transport system substrate-binding protein
VDLERTTTLGRGTLPILRLLSLSALLVLLLAACGAEPEQAADTAPAEQSTQAAGEAATPAGGESTEEPAPDDTVTEDADGALTVYSGRNEELVGPLMEQFTTATGIEVQVRYGDTAELAATILEEGGNSPADVYFGQDAGALGALENAGVLSEIPQDSLDLVEDRFRSGAGSWVGVSGRARVLAYNTDEVAEADLPSSVLELAEEAYRGRVGWAPTNGSFQAFVTALRVELGDEQAREWLEGMIANDVQVYEKNTAIVEAVGRGEIDFGLPNHYYLYQFLAEDPSFPVANHFFDGGDVGSLVNVAGAGILQTTDQPSAAAELVAFLLSEEAQEYFRTETFEYPLVQGVPADDRLPALDTIETPDLDLGDIDDLQGTLELLRSSGALS